jgi:hypothetical protein
MPLLGWPSGVVIRGRAYAPDSGRVKMDGASQVTASVVRAERRFNEQPHGVMGSGMTRPGGEETVLVGEDVTGEN